MREREKPTRTFVRTDYEQLSQERYKDFKAGYNKAVKKACGWLTKNIFNCDDELLKRFCEEMEK